VRQTACATTAPGEGFAIPHARIGGIARPLTLFMRMKLAIAFDAPDRQPVSQLLAIMVPADGAKDDHLHLLALVARLFSDRGFGRQLDSAPDATAAAAAFSAGIAQGVCRRLVINKDALAADHLGQGRRRRHSAALVMQSFV
jgi:PTS system nitrogen regulatory IIA component